MAKRIGDPNDTKNEITKLVNDITSGVDSTMGEAVGDDVPKEVVKEFSLQETVKQQADQIKVLQETINKQQGTTKGATLLSEQDYEGFSPDIKTFGRKPQGLSSASISNPQTIDFSGDGSDSSASARAATKLDIMKLAGELDESMIMNMPFIKASSNIVPGILFLKPKDPTIRFRWVNFKNWEGGNYQKMRALGFVNASPDDIDKEKTPIGENCIDGTEIKWYDVILMKINVFVLMGLYKANIMGSLEKVGRFQRDAKSQAQQEFNNLLGNSLIEAGSHKGEVMISAYKRLERAVGKSLVNFYVPGVDNKSDKDFDSDMEFLQTGANSDLNFSGTENFPSGISDGSYAGIGAKVQGYTK